MKLMEEKEREREREEGRCNCIFFQKISNRFKKDVLDIVGTIIFIAFKLNKISF